MHYLIYALIAYAFWAFATILDKIIREKYIKNTLALVSFFGIMLFAPMIIVAPFVGVTFAHGTEILLALLSGALVTLCFLPYAKSLEFEEISRIAPLWNITPVFVLLLGFVFLKEHLTVYSYIGFFLLLIGGFLISMRKITLSKALWLMIAACGFLAVSEVLSKYVYGTLAFWDGLFWMLLGCFLSSLLLLFVRNVRRVLSSCIKKINRKTALQLVGYALIGFTARLFYYYAIKLGSVTLTTVTAGSEGVFVFVYALLFARYLPGLLKEELEKKVLLGKVISIVLMVAGLWFIYQ